LNQVDEDQMAELEMTEGEFVDKFSKINLARSEAMTIDCPLIKYADVLECKYIKEKEEDENVTIFGEILVSRRA
jgi:flavin reductase (DIM6/NTAB) family NADH-FMN oxidoreductase RutF